MNPNMPYDSNALKNMVSRVKVYCSHILPLVFDNTLSYYESLCAFCAKVNELCDAVNAQNLTIAEFTHMVEVEITKFEEYVQTELTALGDRVTTVEGKITAVENRLEEDEEKIQQNADDIDSIENTLREALGRLGTVIINEEQDRQNIEELQTIASTHSGQIMILQNTLSALQTTVNQINSALSSKVDRNDVVDVVQENNMNPVTSNAVYETVTGGITPVIADATRSTKGVVQIGDNINVSNGEISVPNASQLVKGVVTAGAGLSVNPLTPGVMSLNTATENVIGGVKVGDNLNVENDGTLSVPEATTSDFGVVKVGENLTIDSNDELVVKDAQPSLVKGAVTIDAQNSNLTLLNGVLNVPTGTKNIKGVLQVGDNLTVNGGVVDVPNATPTSKGVVGVESLDSGLSVVSGQLKVNNGDTLYFTNLNKLEVKRADDTLGGYGVVAPKLNGGIKATNGEIELKDATTQAIGGVYLTNTITDGDTTHVPTADAVYDAITGQTPPQIADATRNSKGIVQIGDNIEVSSGEISVPQASRLARGVVKVGSNLTVDSADGTINVPTGSTSQAGILQVGSNLTDTNGVVDVPDASTSTKGVVKYGNNFNINSNGQLAVNLGENVTTDANGAIKVNTADSINKGVVSIGSNINNVNGTISVPEGGLNSKGVLGVSNSNGLIVSNGIVDVNKADELTFGTVKIGDNIVSNNGLISVYDASTVDKGVVQVGDNISVSNGEISVPDATTSTKGVVQLASSVTSGDTSHVPTSGAVYNALTSLNALRIYDTITNNDINSITYRGFTTDPTTATLVTPNTTTPNYVLRLVDSAFSANTILSIDIDFDYTKINNTVRCIPNSSGSVINYSGGIVHTMGAVIITYNNMSYSTAYYQCRLNLTIIPLVNSYNRLEIPLLFLH